VDQVVLLNEHGEACGTQDKTAAHHQDTPLHLAFSCYLFNSQDQFLLTRRADSKKTWPGVWTNSCCGHPGLGEDMVTAVRRRLRQELGVSATDVTLILPTFRYRARMDDGMLENEMCPVFRAWTDSEPAPDPMETAETHWVDWEPFVQQVRSGDRAVSPWCSMQITALSHCGATPKLWPRGDETQLPAACHVASGR